jgi:ABC-type amino acid transport system permease subunit
MEAYSIAALLYLVMTLGLALIVRWVEQNLRLP